MRRLVLAAALALACAGTAVAAPPSPPALPGWPRAAPAGSLLQGPGGGVVVVSEDDPNLFTVAAFRRDGRRLWTNRHAADCGNCDEGPQFPVLQPDGSYGPIGPEGDDTWAVSSRGARVRACVGVMFPNRVCVVAFGSPDLTVEARLGARTLWSVTQPGYTYESEGFVPPMTVRDGTGLVYTAFEGPVPAAGPSAAPAGILLAVDPRTRKIAWTRTGPTQALVGLSSGVVVQEEGRIVALGADGAERWSQPLSTSPDQVIADPLRDRLYVGTPGEERAVHALSVATGATLWQTAGRDQALLLSVGRSGRVYLSTYAPSGPTARAVRFSDGATVWQRRTNSLVMGMRELTNGTVAISVAPGLRARTQVGRMVIVDPRRPRVAATSP